MKKKVLLFFLIIFAVFLFNDEKNVALAANTCGCYSTSNVMQGSVVTVISENDCHQDCANKKVSNPTIAKYVFGTNSVINPPKLITKIAGQPVSSTTGGENCACLWRVVFNYYDVKLKSSVSNEAACMDTCRTQHHEFYAFPSVNDLTIGTKEYLAGDNARYTSNCVCTKGSSIPMYYPIVGKFQATSESDCNNKCATIPETKYITFGANGALSGWKSVVNTPSSSVTNSSDPSGSPSPLAAKADDFVPGTSEDSNKGIIKCGRPGQRMCHLCDIIIGINTIIQYLMKISVFVGIAIIVLGAIYYIISGGDSKKIEEAKKAISGAIIGLVIILTAWMMVNYTMKILQAKDNLGIEAIGSGGWSNFKCNL